MGVGVEWGQVVFDEKRAGDRWMVVMVACILNVTELDTEKWS